MRPQAFVASELEVAELHLTSVRCGVDVQDLVILEALFGLEENAAETTWKRSERNMSRLMALEVASLDEFIASNLASIRSMARVEVHVASEAVGLREGLVADAAMNVIGFESGLRFFWNSAQLTLHAGCETI